MSGGGLANLAIMRQLEERQVEQEVQHLLWSPKMDILALGFKNAEVSLYRLNWQKIWTVTPPSSSNSETEAECTAIHWRPDGKVLAIAYNSGEISILDIESSVPIHRNFLAEGGISFLNWIQCPLEHYKPDDPLDSDKEDIWDFLTKFPSLSKAYSYNPSSQEETEECKKLDDGGTISLLLVGTDAGTVHIYINGFLLCAKMNVSELLGYSCEIQEVTVDTSLMTFSVLVLDTTKRVELLVYSMPLISVCFNELVILSKKYSILSGTMHYMSETIKQISESWEGILLEMDTKLTSYANKLPEGGMAADFLDLLMFGTPSTELEHFLCQELTEKGLKKLGHSIEVSYSNVQRLVLKYLHTVSQSLNFHLAEIVGLAKASEKFPVLGITEDRIIETQRKASSFWNKGIELQQVIDESMKNFKAFFRWLYVEILKLSDETISEELSKVSQQDIRFIADFLESFDTIPKREDEFSHKYLEKVGQYLKMEDLEQPVDRSKNPWHAFLKENPEIAEIPFIIKVNENTSLLKEHESLKTSLEGIFENMNQDMTAKCLIRGRVRLPFTGLELRCRQFNSWSNSQIFGIITEGSRAFDHGNTDSLGNKLLFYQMSNPDSKVSLRGMWITFQSRDVSSHSMKIIGCQFYTSEILSLLLGDVPVSDDQRLVQLPLTSTEPHLRDIDHNSFSPTELGLDSLTSVNVFDLAGQACHRELENMSACQFSVSGPRKVAVFLFRNKKRIRIYEMEVEEDEDDEENETLGNSGMSSELNTSN